jgi:hypothetical protein
MLHRTAIALALVLSAPAAAQRPVHEVDELDDYTLSSLITDQGRVEQCANRTDTSAYVATVSARVSAGPTPSTLYNARVQVSVVSRPRDTSFERCVRSALVDALRHEEYAVGSAARARHTFQIAERPERPVDERPPPYSEGEVRQVLSASGHSLQSCLEMGGVPERVALRVSVRPDGRLVLMSADVPPGASSGALGCLASRVSSMRVSGRPARTVSLVYELGVRRRAF